MKKLLSQLMIILLCVSFISPAITYASTIKINKKSAVVIEGDYLYLKITGTKKKVTWTSSNEYVANVSKKGKVETVSEGVTTITAKVGKKKYKCKVVVILNLDPDYLTDRDAENALAQRNYLDKIASDTPLVTPTPTPVPKKENSEEDEIELQERMELVLKYGFSSSEDAKTEFGKAYIKFRDEWVSEYELKNSYKISVCWNIVYKRFSFDLYPDDFFCIENTPQKFTSGEIYMGNDIQYQYLEEFEYNGESRTENAFFFNREDLINKEIITK